MAFAPTYRISFSPMISIPVIFSSSNVMVTVIFPMSSFLYFESAVKPLPAL